MSSINGAIKSLIFMPIPVDCPEEDSPLVAVMTDKISLNEEIISAEEEEEPFVWIPVPGTGLDVDEMGLEMFVIMLKFYA
jgi:hypothetical protein